MRSESIQKSFYFPLVGNLEESDEYEPYEVDNSFLRCYEGGY